MNNVTKAILCIDDEKIILDSLKSQLREDLGNDYQIEVAESAEEGFEVIDEMCLSNVKVLIIVSDWLMPQTKGDEFLIEVHKKYPAIVKVMLTGQATESAIQRACEEANLYRVIKKPWQKDELIEVVKNGLAEHAIQL